MCVGLPARQVEGQALLPAISSFLMLSPRERGKHVPDVLLIITPQSFLTSPPFFHLSILLFFSQLTSLSCNSDCDKDSVACTLVSHTLMNTLLTQHIHYTFSFLSALRMDFMMAIFPNNTSVHSLLYRHIHGQSFFSHLTALAK